MPDDRYWMEQALALAALGDGTTRPNPMVGSLIVKDGIPAGYGYHRRPGCAHAEVEAIRAAGDLARGATLYVNLEPCTHHGRTPPCTDAILKAGIRRVVASIEDPNPEVAGRGIAVLQEAGVEVSVGLLREEAERMNGPFLKLHGRGRPLVTLKAAVSLDGRIAGQAGNARWITGKRARSFAHRLRWIHDAVLVGAGTVRKDDPILTVRLDRLEKPGTAGPLRVVLSASLDLDPGLNLLRAAETEIPPVRVYTANGNRSDRLPGVELVEVPENREGRLDLSAVLDDLGRTGIRSVLVEGGAGTFRGFLNQGLVDRYAIFRAPVILGEEGGTPMIDLPASPSPKEGWWFDTRQELPLGNDRLALFDPRG